MQRLDNDLAITRPALALPKRRVDGTLRQGLFGSVLLHGVGFLLIAALALHRREAPADLQTVPVEIVYLEENSGPPGQAQPAPAARRAAHLRPAVSVTPRRLSPTGDKPPSDALDAKLRSLSKARMATSPAASTAENTGSSNRGTTGQGGQYALRDYIRAQVERRWSLDIQKPGNLTTVVSIAIEITANGTITKAQIVDPERAAVDKAYRDLAISARNAVLLSSPITLPPGQYKPVMQLTLDLDPRKTLR
ncbi:MAG TPA: hypothetical protein VL026_10295 [Rhizomicrobium sp.]|nr:hypothetical protein [Rhizomicrobium sp.]